MHRIQNTKQFLQSNGAIIIIRESILYNVSIVSILLNMLVKMGWPNLVVVGVSRPMYTVDIDS